LQTQVNTASLYHGLRWRHQQHGQNGEHHPLLTTANPARHLPLEWLTKQCQAPTPWCADAGSKVIAQAGATQNLEFY
jgi:hypothetical protein